LKVNVSSPNSYTKIFDIEIPKEEVEKEYNQKLIQYKNQANIPGFRVGKTPISLIKARFGKAAFSESIEALVEKSFKEACRQNNFIPISQAKISNLKAEEGLPLSYTVEFEIDPPIEIKDYHNLGIKLKTQKVSEENIDDFIKELQKRNAELKDVSRPAQKGDFIEIEYEKIIIDGKERKDLISKPKYPIELGSGKLREFDDAIIGHNVGETVNIETIFPQDFEDERLKGKKAFFSIKIVGIKEEIIPELTQEFLKKIGNFESVEKLREAVRTELEQKEKEKAKYLAYQEAIDKIIEKNKFEIPESLIQIYLDSLYEKMYSDITTDEPIALKEEFQKKYRETAIKIIKREKIIDYISLKEKIKPTQEEVDQIIKEMSIIYKTPFDELKQKLRMTGETNRIRDDLREQKTLDFLIGEYVLENKNEKQ